MAVGVEVRTSTIAAPPAGGPVQAATYFVAGLTERGSVTQPVEVLSMADYATKLGARVTYGTLHDDLSAFFASGGRRAQVARVVGPAAVVATRDLMTAEATPRATLRVDAVDPGAWGNTITVEVTAGTAAGTFNVIVRYGTSTETFSDMPDPATAAERISRDSQWVNVVDLGIGVDPAPAAATALAGGTDDRAAVTATTHTDALARFDESLGAGAVAIPGQPADLVVAGVVTHCSTFRRVGLLATAKGQTVTQATTLAGTLRAAGREWVALVYPWVSIPDPAGARLISPEGAVAGRRAAVIAAGGPWDAPAGANGLLSWVVDVERHLGRTDVNTLNDAQVVPIRRDRRVYGWRSLSTDTDNYRLLSARDVLNYVAVAAEQLLDRLYAFATIDGRGQLTSRVAGSLVGIVDPIATAGGLYPRMDAEGTVIDPGYTVDTGPAVNTTESLARNELRARVGMRVSPTGELIIVDLVKAQLQASLT